MYISLHDEKLPEGKTTHAAAGLRQSSGRLTPPHSITTTSPQPCRPREYAFAKPSFPARLSLIESTFICHSIRFQFFSPNLSTLSFTWVQNGTRHFFTPPSPLFWSTTSMQIFAFLAPKRYTKSMWHHHKYFCSKARFGSVRLPGALQKTRVLGTVSCSPPPLRLARPCLLAMSPSEQRPV